MLLCDTFPGRLPDDIPSYVSMFETLFHHTTRDINFEVFMAMNEELPETLHHDEVYLIPGCMYSSYDNFSWIEKLQRWIQNAVAQNIFLVGVCFGHQVIAQALGGKVEKFPGGWGTGIRESHIVDESLLEFFPDGRLRLLYNHHDQVVTLPDCAVPLASSDFCQFEAFRIGDHVYTFQGHPEYTPYYMRFYLNNLASEQDPKIIEKAFRSLDIMTPQGIEIARWIIGLFDCWRHDRQAIERY